MMTADDHLIASQVEELAYEYSAKGYRVTVRPPETNGVDLVAEKDGQRLAFYVRTARRLGGPTTDHTAMRDEARKWGYTDVKLHVASPYRRVRIDVADIDLSLFEYLRANHPAELDALPGGWVVTRVAVLEYSSVNLEPDACVVDGTGVVEALQHHPDGAELPWKFHLTFSVELTGQLQLRAVRSITVDTSEYEE